jgi:hypothetical protein
MHLSRCPVDYILWEYILWEYILWEHSCFLRTD